MKKTFRMMGLCALIALAAVACKKNEQKDTVTFRATISQPATDAKTHLGSDSYLYWNEGDTIKVFDAEGNASIFFTTENDVTSATFTGTDPIEVEGNYTAYYPAANAEKQGDEILLTLPATQTYAHATFGNATYPMAAGYNATDGFTFGSDCGLLALQVQGTGNIGSIELTGKNSENLAGQLRYDLNGTYQGLTNAQTKVTLSCGNLSLDPTNATTFYFALPAGVFNGGFTAVLKNGDTELYTLETSKNNAIAKETIMVMPVVTVEAIGVTTGNPSDLGSQYATISGSYVAPLGMSVTEVGFYYGTDTTSMTSVSVAVNTSFSYYFDNNLEMGTTYYYQAYAKNGTKEYRGELKNFTTNVNPYATPLTLEALSDGNIQVNISSTLSTGMKYSVNNGAKALITTTTDINVNAGDKVQFYGNGTSTQVYGYNPTVKLLGSAQTKVYGNIMSLIDEGNYASCTTLPNQEYVFSGLFRGNGNLTDASGLLLPATTLAPNCYASMFRGCSSLQTAPELLPATTLAPSCYYYMFYDCTSLTTVPALPATMLAEKCYYFMFRNCMSLQTVPSDLLPATTLANECYSSMFYSCSSLTTAPTLPATTLAPYCYASMFRGCSSLQTAPELLPAPELAPNCYYYMFYGCTSLTTVPALPATMLANSCYANMFQDCKGLQTVPSDLLPATTLANECYSNMFNSCSSLTTAPTLPATTLAAECYYRMFENCSQLNSITCLATSGINADLSTMYWVSGVASSGTFTKAAGASWPTGNHGIPSGWTVVSQ